MRIIVAIIKKKVKNSSPVIVEVPLLNIVDIVPVTLIKAIIPAPKRMILKGIRILNTKMMR